MTICDLFLGGGGEEEAESVWALVGREAMPIEEVPFPSAGKWHPLSMTAGLQRVIKFQIGNIPMIYFY